jgi:hypothetical protein
MEIEDQKNGTREQTKEKRFQLIDCTLEKKKDNYYILYSVKHNVNDFWLFYFAFLACCPWLAMKPCYSCSVG